MVLRPGDLRKQRLHLRLAVGVGRDAAAVERYGVDRRGEQPGQREVLVRDVGPSVVESLFELHGDAFARAARDDALLGEVLPEEEIEQEPDTGGEQ